MAVQYTSKQQHLLVLLLLVLGVLYAAAHAATQPNPDCPTKCGSVSIPFPFGTTQTCSLDNSFLVDCNKTFSSPNSPPTPFLPQSNITVLSISLNGELRVSSSVGSDCYTDKGNQTSQVQQDILLDYFNISTSRNMLTVVGCDTVGLVGAEDAESENYTTGCVSLCNKIDDTTNGSCSGTGCCQTAIPGHGISTLSNATTSLFQHRNVHGFNPCGYAFVVEDGGYEFVSTDLDGKLGKATFPVVLDWTVGSQTCQQARKNAASYA